MDGDISNLAGRVPLGRSDEPEGPGSSSEADTQGRRWPPFWAGIFVIAIGLLSWGAIAIMIAGAIE